MKLLLHKGRHVVVADLAEDAELGDSAVKVFGRVAVADSVVGAARRGRPCNYSKPVPASDLEVLDEVSQEWLEAANELMLKLTDEADVEDSSTETTEETEVVPHDHSDACTDESCETETN